MIFSCRQFFVILKPYANLVTSVDLCEGLQCRISVETWGIDIEDLLGRTLPTGVGHSSLPAPWLKGFT